MKRFFWSLFFLMLLVPLVAGVYFLQEFGHETDRLVNYRPQLTTRIYDRHGDLIANVFGNEHRLYVRFDAIPPRLVEALVAIEDTTFS